jgi:glycosyltransferase involved in cell wall biosynthesis
MKISVVIPTFQRCDSLRVVLPSLLRQSFDPTEYEILLCDAGSTDGTRELVQELDDDRLRFLPGPNAGRSGARNRGVRSAAGDLVLFTDADIIADPELLMQHWDFQRRFPGDAVVGCEVQVDTLEQYELFRQDPQKHARHKVSRKKVPWHYFLTGNASARKADLLRVGIFDEGFTGYGHEDLELGYRLQKAGCSLHYNPHAVNYHWHPVPYPEQCQKMYLAGKSTVRFYQKHRDLRIPLIMGMNPLSLGVHALMPKDGWLYRKLERWAQRSRLAREILLQHHYVSGIRSVWPA